MIGGSLAALYSLIRATGQTLKAYEVNVGNWHKAEGEQESVLVSSQPDSQIGTMYQD